MMGVNEEGFVGDFEYTLRSYETNRDPLAIGRLLKLSGRMNLTNKAHQNAHLGLPTSTRSGTAMIVLKSTSSSS